MRLVVLVAHELAVEVEVDRIGTVAGVERIGRQALHVEESCADRAQIGHGTVLDATDGQVRDSVDQHKPGDNAVGGHG